MKTSTYHPLPVLETIKAFLQKHGHALNCTGVGVAIASAAINASNTAISPFAWIGYLVSSAFLLGWAVGAKNSPQVLMNFSFFCVNMLGVFRWLV